MEMRMGFVKNSLILLVVVALLAPAVAAGGLDISAVGAKARGMGGAFRAVADDWTAAYYNPAGYAYIYDNQLGANFSFVHLRNELNPDYNFGGYEVGFFNDQYNYNKHEVLSIPSGGFMFRVPLFGESVVGFSSYQLFDNNVTWTLMDIPHAYNDSLILPDDQFSNNLDVVAFQLTFARELSEKMSFGIGLQLLRADLIHSNVYMRDNPYPAPLGVRPWDKVIEFNKNNGNGYGFGFTAGILFKASEKLNVGLNARVPFNITISGDSRVEFYMPLIETPIDSVGVESPASPGTAGNLFVAGEEVFETAEFETELKLPTSFGLGLAFQATEKLKVAVDFEYTLWSKFEGFDFTFTNHQGLTGAADTSAYVNTYLTRDLSHPVEWDDAFKMMLGLSYEASEKFTFLGGVGYDQAPSESNMYLTPQFMETGNKFTLSGGFVWHYRNWDFTAATSYSKYPEETVADMTDLNNDGLYDTFNGDFKAETYETVLSFNYRF